MTQKRLSVLGIVLYMVMRGLWASLVVLAPALGVWVASSLAAYRNGPVWLACAAGLLLFPVLPVLWDMVSELLRRRRARGKDRRILTAWDRIVLRTLVLNLLFLGGLLWSRPEAAFTALSTRGDWFLEQVDHPLAERARARVLAAADGLQWLYEAAHDNQYADMVAQGDRPASEPEPPPTPSAWDKPFERAPGEATDAAPVAEPAVEAPVPADSKPASPTAWPQPEELHPAILTMPAEARVSIEAVGRYLAAQEPAPARRIKAIHDFVATHLAYDAAAYYEGRYPDQSAEGVFISRLSVCAGYANLFKAIADVTKDEVVVVVGDARGASGAVEGEPHAWNAARVDGAWYLIDATWDSGALRDKQFVREYRTDYLFVPPELIGISHFPEDPAWQLREAPIGRGEFSRQPMMRPAFFAEGLSLEEPRRSQITVHEDFVMRLGNPKQRYLMVKARPASGGVEIDCALTGRDRVEALCSNLSEGTYNIKIFASPVEFGTYHMVGEVQVHSTGG